MHDTIGSFASHTLAGDPLAIPEDLRGPTLLIFAYRQWQQRDVDTWLGAVAGRDDVRVLEIPTMGRRYLPARTFIDGGMASQMDRATREQTMCVYTDVRAFRRDVLGVDSSAILAVLVDADGAVLWSQLGRANEDGARELHEHIDRATEAPVETAP